MLSYILCFLVGMLIGMTIARYVYTSGCYQHMLCNMAMGVALSAGFMAARGGLNFLKKIHPKKNET